MPVVTKADINRMIKDRSGSFQIIDTDGNTSNIGAFGNLRQAEKAARELSKENYEKLVASGQINPKIDRSILDYAVIITKGKNQIPWECCLLYYTINGYGPTIMTYSSSERDAYTRACNACGITPKTDDKYLRGK